MTIITRRNVLQGIIAAPAVIAVERLMKVKLWVPDRPQIITKKFNHWREVDILRQTVVFHYIDDTGPHRAGPFTMKELVEHGIGIRPTKAP